MLGKRRRVNNSERERVWALGLSFAPVCVHSVVAGSANKYKKKNFPIAFLCCLVFKYIHCRYWITFIIDVADIQLLRSLLAYAIYTCSSHFSAKAHRHFIFYSDAGYYLFIIWIFNINLLSDKQTPSTFIQPMWQASRQRGESHSSFDGSGLALVYAVHDLENVRRL